MKLPSNAILLQKFPKTTKMLHDESKLCPHVLVQVVVVHEKVSFGKIDSKRLDVKKFIEINSTIPITLISMTCTPRILILVTLFSI